MPTRASARPATAASHLNLRVGSVSAVERRCATATQNRDSRSLGAARPRKHPELVERPPRYYHDYLAEVLSEDGSSFAGDVPFRRCFIVERRSLGSSGIEVSALGLGTWAMGGAVEEWGQVDDRESVAAIHQALDCGINLIDTAPVYGLGHSEEIAGKAVKGRRDEAVLATKCGLLRPKSPRQPPRRCLTRDSILGECEESLRRLQTEVIDLYQCHWPDPETNIRETMGALTTLLRQGKIRAIGLCNFSCEQIAAAREFGRVDSVQSPFSLLNRRAADDLLPDCVEHGIAVLPCGPLGRGLLTGKFNGDTEFEGLRARDSGFMGKRYRRNLEIVHSLAEIAARHGKTAAQIAINWVAMQPGVTAPVVGAKRPSQVAENVGGVGWCLTEEDCARIDRLLGGFGVGT